MNTTATSAAPAEPARDRFRALTTEYEEDCVETLCNEKSVAVFVDLHAPIAAFVGSIESRIDHLCELTAALAHVQREEVRADFLASALNAHLQEVQRLVGAFRSRLLLEERNGELLSKRYEPRGAR